MEFEELPKELAHHISDKQAFNEWERSEFTDDDLDHIEAPTHGLDPATVCALVRLTFPVDCESGKVSFPKMKSAFRRWCVLSALVSGEIGGEGFSKLAAKLTAAGIPTSRACLSLLHVQIAEHTGINKLGRGDRAKGNSTRAATFSWIKRKKEKEAN